MSAELLVITTPVPTRTGGSALLGPEHREFLHARVDGLLDRASEPVLATLEDALGPDASDAGSVRQAVREAVDHLFVDGPDGTHTWPQDVIQLDTSHVGRPVILTGGMSHGDDPTDSWRHFELLNALGAFEQPFDPDLVGDTPTMRVRVVEQVTWTVHVELTDDILDEAEQAGYTRDASGVADLLVEDVDHQSVVDQIDPTAPDAVEEREVSVDADALEDAMVHFVGQESD